MLIIHHRVQDAGIAGLEADHAEVDVMMTADSVAVCRHDHIYEGRAVWEQEYAQDMGPTLAQFTLAYTGELIVELKMPESHWQAGLKFFEKVVLAVAPEAMFASFSVASLAKLRKLDEDAVLIANTHNNRLPDTVDNLMRYVNGIAVPLSQLEHHVSNNKFPLFVYTVNDPDELRLPEDHNVIGVFTDYPEKW